MHLKVSKIGKTMRKAEERAHRQGGATALAVATGLISVVQASHLPGATPEAPRTRDLRGLGAGQESKPKGIRPSRPGPIRGREHRAQRVSISAIREDQRDMA